MVPNCTYVAVDVFNQDVLGRTLNCSIQHLVP